MGLEKIGKGDLASKVDVVDKEELAIAFNLNSKLTFTDNNIDSEDKRSSNVGNVIVSSHKNPEDSYSSVQNKGMHAMHLRLEHLFDMVEGSLSSEFLPMFEYNNMQDCFDSTSNKLTSKPVVIGDALSLPDNCPETVEQLFEAALAHHNLGCFEEALKFLEAARVQLIQVQKHALETEKKSSESHQKKSAEDIEVEEQNEILLPLDFYVYVTICKGNVYQSCGDDENSLLLYFECLKRAISENNQDWEMICINNIGMLAYYNVKYQLALKCFSKVANFREKVFIIINFHY